MTPEKELAGFIAKFSPQVAALARRALDKLRARLPGAVELVYDNYNALAIGFAPGDKYPIFSIALYPRWVSLFFLQAKKLPDPKKLLRGNGTVARHIVLDSPSDLDMPGVRALMTEQLKLARQPIDPSNESRIVIKTELAKQLPRRPKKKTR